MNESLIVPAAAEPISLDTAKDHLRFELDNENELIRDLIRTATQHVEDYTRRDLVQKRYRLTSPYFPRRFVLPRIPTRSISSIRYIDQSNVLQTLSPSLYQTQLHTMSRAIVEPAYSETWPTLRLDTLDAVQLEYTSGYMAPVTTDYDSDLNQLTAVDHSLNDGDVVKLWNSSGEFPSGLDQRVNYYVVNATTDTFELSDSPGGAPLDIKSNQTGTTFVGEAPASIVQAMKLMIGHWFRNRESVLVGTTAMEMPFSAKSLLDPYVSHKF